MVNDRVELVRDRFPAGDEQLTCDLFKMGDLFLLIWCGLICRDDMFKVIEMICLTATVDPLLDLLTVYFYDSRQGEPHGGWDEQIHQGTEKRKSFGNLGNSSK